MHSANKTEATNQDLRDAMQAVVRRLQWGQTWLATAGAISPFIGLLGTVWGIFNALSGMAEGGPVRIEQIAGPVGEALVMTAAGLAVAIPAVLGYNLLAVVKASSPYKTLADLKGKKVAHTSPSSNSGNLAPRVLFPAQGLTPDTDYRPLMSGGHDKSVLGVNSGDYDMAAVASSVLEQMGVRSTIKSQDFRVIYTSPTFPTSSFAHAHDLKPELAAKLKECVFSFRFPTEMQKALFGGDRFVPISYQKDWAVVRDVAEKSGTPYNKAAYDAENKREAEAAAKRAAAKAASPASATK